MARGRKPRTWIKIDCEGILRGSINYLLSLDGQAIWVKMIALSEVCGGRPGYIEDNNQRGLPYDYIAHELHCTVELLKFVLDKMSNDEAVKIEDSGAIHLVNFHHYQFSEYDRQKPYRDRKKTEVSNLQQVASNSMHTTIFTHWNSKNIREHRKLTDDIKRAINARSKDYSLDEILKSIDNYALILQGEEYKLMTYRWTLKEFLSGERVEKFLDLEIAKSNYRRDKQRGETSGDTKTVYTDPVYYDEGDPAALEGRKVYTDPEYYD